MRRSKWVLTGAIGAALALAVAGSVDATPGNGRGNPDAGPPGDHGRRPNKDGGTPMGELFGDQWVIVRDLVEGANGVPVKFRWLWPDTAFTDGDFEPTIDMRPALYERWELDLATGQYELVDVVDLDPDDEYDVESERYGLGYDFSNLTDWPICNQPIAMDAPLGITDGTPYAWAYVDSYGMTVPRFLLPLDPECSIPVVQEATWGTQVLEVASGRLNVGRSPQAVLDASYDEALTTLASATDIGLDPAGRLTVTLETLDEEGNTTYVARTIDAPLENLALYQMLMRYGCLVGYAGAVTLPSGLACSNGAGDAQPGVGTRDPTDLLRAASFLAGAADKAGAITVDLVIYLNAMIDVPQNDILNDIVYFDFGSFTYSRLDVSRGTATLLQPTGPDVFHVVSGVDINGTVFQGGWPYEDATSTPIVAFVRAADDALSVVEYLHNYELPVVLEAVP